MGPKCIERSAHIYIRQLHVELHRFCCLFSLSLSVSTISTSAKKEEYNTFPPRPVFLRNKYACRQSKNDFCAACIHDWRRYGTAAAGDKSKTILRQTCTFWKSSKLARQETHYNKVFIFTTLHGRFSFSSSSLSLSHLCMVRCPPYHWRKNGTADVEPGTELHISAGRIHTWGGEGEQHRYTAHHLGERFFEMEGTQRGNGTRHSPLRRKAKTACIGMRSRYV